MDSRITISVFLAAALSVICVHTPALGHPDDIYWEPGPGILNEGGQVNTILLDHFHDLLIVAGSFSSVDGIPANNIAAWDGTSWSALGDGTDGPVNALTVWSGLIFAGGEFTTAGGVSALNVAMWTGDSWMSLGAGVDGVVTALEDWNGKIYAGRYDPSVYVPGYPDPRKYASIRVWDFSSWTHFAGFYLDQLTGYWPRCRINDLQVYYQELTAGGHFWSVASTDAIGVAKWNGTSWSALRGDRNSSLCRALAWFDGDLVEAGWNIVRIWDGADWTDLWELGPVYCDDIFRTVAIFEGKIVAGGEICSFDYELHHWLMEWDGSEWSQLGSGFDAPVQALCVYDGKLIAGGSFTVAGGKDCCGLATWNPESVAVLITGFHADGVEKGIELTWSLSSDERIEGFRIYRTGKEGNEVLLNRAPIAPESRSYTDETALPGERYLYTLAVLEEESGEIRSFSVEAGIPSLSLSLSQNQPNPFNPSTSISYTLPEPAHVTLRIYSPSGRLVRTLVDGFEEAGRRETAWDGTGDDGRPMTSGVYFYRLTAGKETLSRKMLLLR